MITKKSVLFSGLVGIIIGLNSTQSIGQNKNLNDFNATMYIINQNNKFTQQILKDSQKRNRELLKDMEEKRNKKLYSNSILSMKPYSPLEYKPNVKPFNHNLAPYSLYNPQEN